MDEALQRWRDDFAREPDTAFDRLVRGVVPLGGASQLSFGEILDTVFEPGDAALDTAAAAWLEKRILGPVPENASLHRWVSVVEEYFRGIAAMELPQTCEILRRQHKRLRLWLHGFYEGPDRDPEGAYLIALARAQDDHRFSPLWRRLILGEELARRPYLGIGILGFRKMPGQESPESSGVPEGLLQALVEFADIPETGQTKWKQTMRSLFATYRRSESYWVEHLAPLLPHYQQSSNARDWLSALLPGIPRWRPLTTDSQVSERRLQPVQVAVSRDWANRILKDPELCETPAFSVFLHHHRSYAKLTGEVGYINKTFNNLAISIIRADSGRAELALSLIEEALELAPGNPHNWSTYAIVLCAAKRERAALDALWTARNRFAWNKIIRMELGRLLRETGDYEASAGVLMEAAGHFPHDSAIPANLVVTLREWGKIDEAIGTLRQAIQIFPEQARLRNTLAELLRDIGKPSEAIEVFEQTCRDYPKNVYCRTGLADLLIDRSQEEIAERLYRDVLEIEGKNPYAEGGLARALSIRAAKNRDVGLRDFAKHMLQDLAHEGNQDAQNRLLDFDEHWKLAILDPTITFRRPMSFDIPHALPAVHAPTIEEMRVAERLGRAMISLWQAERAEDATQRSSLCAHATALLELPEDQIDDDLLAPFVETRGLVMLASGDAQRALAYFEEQIHHYGRGGWIGIQLGDQRARISLGVPKDADDTVEAPSSQSARFALYVTRVIQTLATSPQESEVRELLKTLYPRAAGAQPDAEGGLSIESGVEMLGAFLQTRWFRPAGIQSAEDLNRPDALRSVIERINHTRIDTFDVISNSVSDMAFAA